MAELKRRIRWVSVNPIRSRDSRKDYGMKTVVGISILVVSFPFVVLGFLVAIPIKGLIGGYDKIYEDVLGWIEAPSKK